MVDKKLLEYLEGFVTEKRKGIFKKVLSERTKHFTVVLEDIYTSEQAVKMYYTYMVSY